ncbi:LEAF RUST 10 DISEASE-RESISTANCE LOCUS RECEPTOR-LIKE PROTEIN KINASE-like 1.2 [Sorghum bicolor]|uniref:Protein kinase domain-containing protein n=1 Tax=Sorghum bicolor TaxID=4558 RepID=A0A1B6Q1Z3_SORBI|nr:LEAF RUST 10 DISEASE-RESISTANCE LOCUS RECEPTOR-LIKE PROTEIN KINASE-like 1.2 [Sorghum bicolor]KXG31948.1 hypothetical protein SORBI_3003G081100 [Sorghum bicolor]OQU86380.1 hypothetical protein SORBI_3003G081100 [Sorghum bicolor]|eukprot:XP_021310909.1 LEAF RUST 10 DISEASE-RESISTANCE LOCUS RECEPTOR-LIKE PROTEIN KINASE-like 1.2 [Sorghum bicolor]
MQIAAAVVVVVALLLPLSTLLLRLGCLATATADADTNRTTSGGNDTSCAPARCGNLSVTYPFSLAGVHPLECGYPAFGLTCDAAAGRTYLSRTFRVNLYRVLSISYDSRSMVVAVETAFSGDGACKIPDFNVSSGLGLFPVNISAANRDDLTFVYNCKIPHNEQLTGPCSKHGVGAYISERPADELQSTLPPQWVQANCTSASVPVRGFQDGMNLTRDYERLMSDGFVLDWPTLGDCDACKRKGGQCRFFELSFQCVNSSTSSRGGTKSLGLKIAGGIAAALLCAIILSIGLLLVLHKRRKRKRSASLAGLIRDGSPLASLRKEFSMTGSPRTHIFTYEELDEATDGFSDERELGVGGFGTVYKGTLLDGSVVAVKRLYKNSYKSVEQFQNEVEILSRLRHPNLVTLYGCTSPGSSRDLLLVYEYVPNGTLADHLHGARAEVDASSRSSTSPPPLTPTLSWPVRLGIAVETASALEYLHGVEPHQVVHRDVKTNNILLDAAFHVKVADFGLSRLFPAHATHVSTAPQGTPGYLDPMYHQCYQLTDKSDVYSFGVVLVELISSKPAVDMSRARGGDVNLATMAVHMIQCYEIDRLVDPRIGYRTDGGTKRAVDLVAEMAFRCLQPEQDVRPPISEVLDALREAQRMQQDGCAAVKAKDDMGLLKKSRDGSPDSVMHQWTSPCTTTHNSS